MKWEEYQKQQRAIPPDKVLVDVECPKCGMKIYRRTDVVLTTYPPMHGYVCENCGWTGTA